ncbi:MAG: ABC transporter permease [Myxococcales bacterium]
MTRAVALVNVLRRVLAMAQKELSHIRRDPQTLIMSLGMPVGLLLLFGFGVSFDLEHLPIAAVDQDQSSVSRQLTRDFDASGDFVVTSILDDVTEGEAQVRRGKAVAVLVIPRGFSRALGRGERAELQLIVDGSDSTTANQTLNKAEASAAAAVTAPGISSVTVPRIVANTWTLYNATGSSALLLVPGLMAMILATVCVLLTALTVAREWERGSMEQLFTTPIRRGELILGKLLPYIGLGFLGVLLVLATGAWIFHVPIRGSLPTLMLAALLFLIGMLGQGLFISVITKNQMVATQVGALTSLLPVQLLSGFVFPIANMPWALQVLAQILPATHFMVTLRGVMLRGNGMREQWVHLLALLAFALFMVLISAIKFRRRLD